MSKGVGEKFDALVMKWWFWVLFLLTALAIPILAALLANRDSFSVNYENVSQAAAVIVYTFGAGHVMLASFVTSLITQARVNIDPQHTYILIAWATYYPLYILLAILSVRRKSIVVAWIAITLTLLNSAGCTLTALSDGAFFEL